MEAAATSVPAAARWSASTKPVPSSVDVGTTNHDHLSTLLEAVGKDRDRAAFAELFRRLAPAIMRLLAGRGVSATVAEELLQETMLLVWRHAATFDRSRASASTWVSAIARNRHLDIVRAAKRSTHQAAYEPWVEVVTGSEPQVDEILGARQSGQLLREAIKTLPREQEEVLRQAFYEERSHREIAAAQRLPLGTVKSRIRLALAHLRTSVPIAELR
jgi:RNA polymerase sigma-70 factor, ECF subfamily